MQTGARQASAVRCAQLSSRQNDCGKIVLAFFAAAAVESGASRTRAHLIDRYAIPRALDVDALEAAFRKSNGDAVPIERSA